MARSKSPGPAKEKSPRKAAKKAPAASAGLDDNAHLGIAIAVLLAIWYKGGGEMSLTGFTKATNEGFDFTFPLDALPGSDHITNIIGKSCNFVFLLHVLNSLSSSRGNGYYLQTFTNALFATFAGVIVPKLLTGTAIADAIFANPDASFSYASFFFMWYAINYEIPFCPHKFDAWNKFADFGGHALELLLGFGTLIFTTNLVIAATGGAQTTLTLGWFRACTMGIIAGTASEFFPFNKGIKFVKSDAHSHAAAVSFFIASNGFAVLDFTVGLVSTPFGVAIPAFGAQINDALFGLFGGITGFVLFLTTVNYFFGHLIAEHSPVPTKSGFDIFGLVEKFFALAQLE
jgi:hypothetical protein